MKGVWGKLLTRSFPQKTHPRAPRPPREKKGQGSPFLAGAIVPSAQAVRNLIQIFVRKVFEKGLGKTFFKKFFPKKSRPHVPASSRPPREKKGQGSPFLAGAIAPSAQFAWNLVRIYCAESF